MRTHSLFVAGFLAGLLAAATIVPTTAEAQFPVDPRALLGRMTAPLRHMLPYPPSRQRVIHRGPSRDHQQEHDNDGNNHPARHYFPSSPKGCSFPLPGGVSGNIAERPPYVNTQAPSPA